MKYEINKYEDISLKLLEKIKENDEVYFNLKKIPDNGDFEKIIEYIVLQKSAKIIDEDNVIEKIKFFDHGYQINMPKNQIYRFYPGKRLNENNNNYLLPIGSVVLLNDKNKMMISGRALIQENDGVETYTDYAGFVFPTGMTDENKYVFNHEDIMEIIQVGLQDMENDKLNESIKVWLDETKINKFKKVNKD